MRWVTGWMVVAGVIAVAMLTFAPRALAAGPTVGNGFSCANGRFVGTIMGSGLTPGLAVNSAVLFVNGSVLAQDLSGRRVAADGTYQSAPLSFAPSNPVDLSITRAYTGAVLASGQFNLPPCFPDPQVSGAATRDCHSGTVSGAVTEHNLPSRTLWQINYFNAGNDYVLGELYASGAESSQPFTTTDVPIAATTVLIRLIGPFGDTNPTSYPVMITLNNCSPASRATRTPAAATPKPTSSTMTASPSATTTVSSARPSSTTTAPSAAPPLNASASAAPVAAAGKPPSPSAHSSGISTWAALGIAAGTLGVGVLGLAGWYIFRAQRRGGEAS